jgi:hypothetical protein
VNSTIGVKLITSVLKVFDVTLVAHSSTAPTFTGVPTMNGATIPTVKVERVPSPHVKPEPGDTAPSPYMDEDDLYEEDAGDLDFSQAQQQLWLSHIPRSLWETWSSINDDEEIEIGTIRVEGMETDPRRVCTSHHPGAFSVECAADNFH